MKVDSEIRLKYHIEILMLRINFLAGEQLPTFILQWFQMETAACERAGRANKQALVSLSSQLSQTRWF